MGNACLVREEDPGADLRHYQACLELEAEVRARLQNTEQLRMECINYYREECIRGDLQLLTKEHWHRRTHDFINRISFNDQRTKERIDIAVDDICSDTGSITEGKFVECMHTALTLALMSLEEKRARYESRYGPMAPGQTPFGGGEAMSSHDESVLMSQSQSHPHEEDWVEKRESADKLGRCGANYKACNFQFYGIVVAHFSEPSRYNVMATYVLSDQQCCGCWLLLVGDSGEHEVLVSGVTKHVNV